MLDTKVLGPSVCFYVGCVAKLVLSMRVSQCDLVNTGNVSELDFRELNDATPSSPVIGIAIFRHDIFSDDCWILIILIWTIS